jgi:hypothetical protein
MSDEHIVAKFEALIRNFLEKADEKHEKPVSISGLREEI